MPVKRKSSRNVSKLSRNNNINQMRPKRSKRSKRASQKKRGRKASKRQRGGKDYGSSVREPGYGHVATGTYQRGDPTCFPKTNGDLPTGCEKVHGKYKKIKKSPGLFAGLFGSSNGK
jgi:hypothetical protein